MKTQLLLLVFLSALCMGCKDKQQKNNGTSETIESENPQETIENTPETPSVNLIDNKEYDNFKSFFPDIIPGEKLSQEKNNSLKKEGIAALLFIANDNELAEGATENLYAVGKITGYKENMDLFVIKHDYTRVDEDAYEGHSDNYIYLAMYKDGEFIKKDESKWILTHTLEVESYGEGGESNLHSFFNNDKSITSHSYGSEVESATGYNTPLITNVTYKWNITNEGKVEISEITYFEFSSPFYDKAHIAKLEEYWKEWGNSRNYPSQNDKWPLTSSKTYFNWEYPVTLFNNDISIFFYIDDSDGNYYPVFESRDEDQNLISSYVVGKNEADDSSPQNVDYSKRSKTLKCPVLIKTSDGDIEILPDGTFRILK